MKTTIVKRTARTVFNKCYGIKFTFADGIEIIANEKIAKAAEILVDNNIEVENGAKYKAISYFYLEVSGKGRSDKLNLDINWEMSFDLQFTEAQKNTYKANDCGTSM